MNTKAKHSSRSRTQKLWLLDHHFPCRARPLVTTVWRQNMWIGLPEKIIPQRFLEKGWHLSGLYPMPHSWWHIFRVSPVPGLPELGRLIMVHLQRPSANVIVFLWDVSDPLSKKARRKGPFPFSSPRLLFLFLLQLVRGWGGGWTARLLCSVRMCGAAFLCFFQRIQASGLVIEVILILRWLLTLGLFLISLSS